MNRRKYISIAAVGVSCLLFRVQGQIVLNEVLADNAGAVENAGEFPDYIELHNTSSSAISLGGMSLSDDPLSPGKFVFPAGSTIPAKGFLVVWCDSSTAPGLHTGFGLGARGDAVELYAANGVTILDSLTFGLQIPGYTIGRVPDGSGSWILGAPTPLTANSRQTLGLQSSLKLNEWMARPATGDDWLEVYNPGSLPVDLSALIFTDQGGTPSNQPVLALSFIEPRGFRQFFASNLDQPDADHLDFRLGAEGETLSIYGSDRMTLLNRVTFGAQQSGVSQGRLPDGGDSLTLFPLGATPGKPNFAKLPTVVVSEVLAHTDPPFEDAIELQNLSDAPLDISYWWLSDSGSEPRKYQIPAGTILPLNGYRAFYAVQFDSGPNAFSLSSVEGDEVYLSAGDASGGLTGEQTFVKFGASRNGIAFGRLLTSIGEDFVPLTLPTFGVSTPTSLPHFRRGNGAPNTEPRIGPVIISEIMFHPPALGGSENADDEYIELLNVTGSAQPLYDVVNPQNTWRVRDGIVFDFPPNVSLPPGGYAVLVSFDPQSDPGKLQQFMLKYSIPSGVQILGPYSGRLSDAGEELKIYWPDFPEGLESPTPGFVPYEIVEKIRYSPAAPWPGGASGTGASLHRKGVLYGDEPLNWRTGAPTPGRTMVQDADGDGMPDDWEIDYQLNPQSAADASQDADNDGLSNLAEFKSGTNPRDLSSLLRLSIVPAQGNLRLLFAVSEGRDYAVEMTERLGGSGWSTFANFNSGATNATVQIQVPPAPNQRFFRLKIP